MITVENVLTLGNHEALVMFICQNRGLRLGKMLAAGPSR